MSTPIRSPSKRKRGDEPGATPVKRSRVEEMTVIDPVPKTVDLFAFGLGEFGQLGVVLSNGKRANERKFAFPVNGMQGKLVKYLTSQGFTNFVILDEGRVVSWGLNDDKLLARNATEEEDKSESSADGDGNGAAAAQATDLDSIVEPTGLASRAGFVNAFQGMNIVRIVCGEYHAAALTDKGEVLTWGRYKENDGWLGYDAEHPEEYIQDKPKLVTVGGGLKIVDIAAGLNAVYALSSTGEVFEWGSLRRASQMVRKRRDLWLTPHAVQLPVKAAKLWAGGYSAYILGKNGCLYGWGLNAKGQLGLGAHDLVNHERPVQLSLTNVVDLSVGDEHALALTQDGRLYSWGVATFGRTGHGVFEADQLSVPEPTEIPFFKNLREQVNPVLPRLIAAGQCHNLVVTSDGSLYSFGFGEGLRLGTGEEDDALSPVRVGGQRLDGRQIVGIAAGSNHNIIALASQVEDDDDSEGDEKKDGDKNDTQMKD